LKNGKSAGICDISPEMVKCSYQKIAPHLLELFRTVWNSEQVPSDWRKGIILPIYKSKNSKQECSNYRGITLLSVPGKLFAYVLLNRMRPYILKSRRREQSGFTPGRSTVDRVLTLNLIAQTRREFRQPLFAAYLDLKAAFDSVDRSALCMAFDIIGIPAKYIRIFQALHTNTESSVRYEGLLSDWFTIQSGVRQGCVLAPDAFNVAMDQVLEHSTCRMMLGTSIGEAKFTDLDFADDVVLFSELYGAIESALQIFEYEASTMGLRLNPSKTKTQSLSDFLPKPPDIWINGSRIECVEKFTYLGVSVDSSCGSSGEISRRIALANNAFGELKSHKN